LHVVLVFILVVFRFILFRFGFICFYFGRIPVIQEDYAKYCRIVK
jgi:hypothetical protein